MCTIQTHWQIQCHALAAPESSGFLNAFTLQDNLIDDRKGPVTLFDLKMVLDLGVCAECAQFELWTSRDPVAVRNQTKS